MSRLDGDALGAGAIRLPAGTAVGKYRIIGKLGEGGMGVVYEAEDAYLQRRVALKVLPKAGPAEDPAVRRFLREAQAAARLNHPHTVTIYEVDEGDGLCYIAMELVTGASAAARVKAAGALPWREATRIIAQVCRGLAAAHAAGLIHRDIKPANILLTLAGDAKLADFGLVKFAQQSVSGLTAPGNVVGTPDYMSPEQCRSEALDERTDVYSLGAAYYSLLAGEAPYEGETAIQVMFAHCSNPPPDPRQVNPEIPEGCAAVIRRAMAKEPTQRYASAREMLADLEIVLAAPPQPAPPPDSASAAGMARRRWLVAAVGAILGTVIVWGVIQSFPGKPAAPATTNRDAPGIDPTIVGKLEGNVRAFPGPITVGGLVLPMGGKVQAVAFSPDGKLLAAGVAEAPGGVKVWEFPSGNPVAYLWPGQAIHALDFSFNSQFLVAGGEGGGGGVKVWNVRDQSGRYLAQGSRAISVACSPREGVVAAACRQDREFKVTIWELETGKELHELSGHAKEVRSVGFSNDGLLLATGGAEGVVRLFNHPAGMKLHEIAVGSTINSVAFTYDRRLAIATTTGIDYRYYGNWKPLLQWPPQPVEITSIAFSRDRKLAVSAGWISNRQGALFHLGGFGFQHLQGHKDAIDAFAFTPNGRVLASGSRDGTVRLWDIGEFHDQ